MIRDIDMNVIAINYQIGLVVPHVRTDPAKISDATKKSVEGRGRQRIKVVGTTILTQCDPGARFTNSRNM